MRRRFAFVDAVLISVILIAGLYLRLQKINWDHGQLAHPDERHVLMVAETVSWPSSLVQALDPRQSPLNPFSRPGPAGVRQPETFAYGHFPIYVLKGLSSLLQVAAEPLRPLLGDATASWLRGSTSLWRMVYAGRFLSALADTATILVTYLLARRLFRYWQGPLLAASLLAFTVLHVQLCHFYAVDTVLALFVTITLYWLVRVAQGGGRHTAILAGISLALAVASKSSAAALGLAWIAAFALRPGSTRGGRLPLLVLSTVAATVTFLIASPYAVLDLPMYLESFSKESGMVRGVYDFPYTRQYRGTPALLYPLEQQLRWGMGWLPGIFGFGGLIWTAWRGLRGRLSAPLTVLLLWAVPYALLTGTFMVKFMRYWAPLTPTLYLLGVAWLSYAGRGRLRFIRALGPASMVYAVVWTLAFSSIYQRPFTRYAASEWIYRNIPAGSVITKEEWDDLIPYGITVDGEAYSAEARFKVLPMPLQEPDDTDKVEMLVDRLSRADYIIVSSNRFYGWLPRLQERFPISNRYYEVLFSGEAGFRLIQNFSSYPSLGPYHVPDDQADESFTVYDHPRVMVFQRQAWLTDQELYALFQSLLNRGEPSGNEDLLLPGRVQDYPVAEDHSWNAWAQDGLPSVAIWWAVVTALGLAAWPLTHWLLGRLWAGSWGLSRLLGLLITGYVVWLGASLGLLANRGSVLWAAAGVLVLLGLVLASARRRDIIPVPAQEWLLAEGIALAAFAGWVLVRIANPDLWQPWFGGERPMEMGFLWAVLRSEQFPPYDPFYAGGYVNYYYYGLHLVSSLAKLTGIPPQVAFNLSLATFFSLTASVAATLAASLVPRYRAVAALAGIGFALLLGNLEGAFQAIGTWLEAGASAPGGTLPVVGAVVRLAWGIVQSVTGAGPSYDWWGPTRVIADTINEFPYFSFLYGDLHPHLLDMPVILAAAAVATLLVTEDAGRAVRAGRLALLALLVGTATLTNTWDTPTIAVLAVALTLVAWARRRTLRAPAPLLGLGIAVVAGIALAYPFLRTYQPPPGGFGWTRHGSDVVQWLNVWGLWAILSLLVALATLRASRLRSGPLGAASLLVRRWSQLPRLLDLMQRSVEGDRRLRQAGFMVLVALAAALVLVLLGRPAGAIALLLALAGLAAALSAPDCTWAAAATTIALAWAVILGTEFVYLKDWLAGGDAYRMNTVFKFGVQAWLLMAMGIAALLVRGWSRLGVMARAVATICLLLGLLYPVAATPTRLAARFPNASPPWGTLDAFAWQSVGRHTWPDDNSVILWAPEQEALAWLRTNVRGNVVVAEAPLGYYREGGSRVATYTGLPIPLGPQHESEQRPRSPLGARGATVERLYRSATPVEARAHLQALDADLIYVGQLEEIVYGGDVRARFLAMAEGGDLRIEHDNGVVAIFSMQ